MDIYYKGFQAKTYFTAEADVFYGEVLNSSHVIAFQAKNLKELEVALHIAVDQYLAYLKKSEPKASKNQNLSCLI